MPGQPDPVVPHPEPLRVVGEITDWKGHVPEVLQTMLDHLAEMKRVEAIND